MHSFSPFNMIFPKHSLKKSKPQETDQNAPVKIVRLMRILIYNASMKIIILSFLFIFPARANFTLLNFNTMCDVCSGSSWNGYSERVKSFHTLFKIYKPELIALQEVRTVSQLKDIIAPFEYYKFVATDSLLMSYADPAIVYDSRRFELIESKNYWLGPDGENSFTFGWKLSLPRQLLVTKLKDKSNGLEFFFASSHFDNRIENLRGGAQLVRKILKNLKAPILFAADTNLTVDMPAYKNLVDDLLINAFDTKKEFSVIGNYSNDKEICYKRKGKKFPQCRVDHVLYSTEAPWVVRKFMIETLKTDKGEFPSDHRPVIVRFTN